MTYGHGQWGGDGLWDRGMGPDGGGQRGKKWDNYSRINKNLKRIKKPSLQCDG